MISLNGYRKKSTEPQIINNFQACILSCSHDVREHKSRGEKGKKKVVRLYRVGRIRQAVEFLLHVLQDFCGRAVLWFAVVDLIQDCIENLHSKKKKKKQKQSPTCELLNCRNRVKW